MANKEPRRPSPTLRERKERGEKPPTRSKYAAKKLRNMTKEEREIDEFNR